MLAPWLSLVCAVLSSGSQDKRTVELRARLHERALWEKEPESQRVMLELEPTAVMSTLKELEALGVELERAHGRVLHVGRLYGARVPSLAMSSVAALSGVLQIASGVPRTVPPAEPGDLDYVPTLLQAPGLHRQRDDDGARLRGQGITFCDIDSGFDPFHPQFFRPDAGFFAWLDVNGDGALSPGDAVDLDGDGEAGAGETLLHLRGAVLNVDETPTFSVGRGWLFADTNGNQRRDMGEAAGFSDDDPGFGEPMFVVDDVNANGAVDLGEKLVRLGTSKVKAVIHLWDGTLYERGVNLSHAPRAELMGMDHATSVVGVLLGGDPDFTRVYGMAPDAEVVVIEEGWPEGFNGNHALSVTGAASLALEYASDIFVHEYGTRSGEFRDGAGSMDALVDALAVEGTAQAVPAHNFALMPSELVVDLAPGASTEVFSEVGAFGAPTFLRWTLRFREGELDDLQVAFESPAGQTIDFTDPPPEYYGAIDGGTSSRGTHLVYARTYRMNAAGTNIIAHAQGYWMLTLTNLGSAALQVHLTADDESYYSYAHYFMDGTGDGSMSTPASADLGIVIGASVANYPAGTFVEEVPLALTEFSGRGPRIDGIIGIDTVAPHDHFAAASDTIGDGRKLGDYVVFGGTSGATPAFAGILALLWQKEPSLSVPELKVRVRDAAREDELTGVTPNPAWGHGRVSGYALVMGETAEPARQLTRVLLPTHVTARRGDLVKLSAALDSDEPLTSEAGLRWFWDIGYDGTVEREGNAIDSISFTLETSVWVRVRVEDEAGYVVSALSHVEVVPPKATKKGGCDATGSAGPAWWLGVLLARRILASRRARQ